LSIRSVIHRDGRQSEIAMGVARGVRRHLRARGFATVAELTLANGRRADLVGVGHRGAVIIVEVKSSVVDFRTDTKWREYRPFCDYFYFAAPEGVSVEIFPQDTGLLVGDSYGAALLRESSLQKMTGSNRRALLLGFARAAADRLHALGDPEWSPD
jgi:hypothetical protein